MKILVIEDDLQIAESIRIGLKSQNFIVDLANDGNAGELMALVNKYDLLITDLNLPGKNGIEICRTLREKNKTLPILMLTVENEVAQKVEALDLGADDYLTKPFNIEELIARISALKRRSHEFNKIPDKLVFEDLRLDRKSRKVFRASKEIELRNKEFSLLEYFMENPGTVLKRTQILEDVWDANADPFTNTVDVHIKYLREKINDGSRKKLIDTIYGIGYKL